MRNKLLLAVVSLAAAMVTSVALQAQEVSRTTTAESFEKWTLGCTSDEAALRCEMVQTLIAAQTGRAIIRLSVPGATGAEDGNRILRIRAPLGVLLAPGIRLSAASIDVALPYNVCDTQGCYATLPIDTTTVRAFELAETGDLIFRMAGGEQPLTATMSFEGFSDALNALEEKLQ